MADYVSPVVLQLGHRGRKSAVEVNPGLLPESLAA
jgi:hypothetical protein